MLIVCDRKRWFAVHQGATNSRPAVFVDNLLIESFKLNYLKQNSVFFTLRQVRSFRQWTAMDFFPCICSAVDSPYFLQFEDYTSLEGSCIDRFHSKEAFLPPRRVQVFNYVAGYNLIWNLLRCAVLFLRYVSIKHEGWKWAEREKRDDVTEVRRLCYWAGCSSLILFDLFSFLPSKNGLTLWM